MEAQTVGLPFRFDEPEILFGNEVRVNINRVYRATRTARSDNDPLTRVAYRMLSRHGQHLTSDNASRNLS